MIQTQFNFHQKRRLFVGIKISLNLQKEILNWKNRYIELLPLRWIEPQNLHITLIPPWNDDPEKIANKLQKIKGIIKPFPLIFTEVTSNPKKDKPRLIWVLGQTPSPLIQTKEYLEKILKRKSNGKDLFMHITLAKVSLPRQKLFAVKPFVDHVNWKETVQAITLFESHLLPQGSQYEVLETVSF